MQLNLNDFEGLFAEDEVEDELSNSPFQEDSRLAKFNESNLSSNLLRPPTQNLGIDRSTQNSFSSFSNALVQEDSSIKSREGSSQKEQSRGNREGPKVFIPSQFHKGKRALNKIVHEYFNELKKDYVRHYDPKNKHCHIYLKSDEVQNVVSAIRKYVGIRHQSQHFLEIDFSTLAKASQKLNSELRNGSFCYMSETSSILNYNCKGLVSEIPITVANKGEEQSKELKIPALATPVPFKNKIYLLDGVNFDKKNNCFFPETHSFVVDSEGVMSKMSGGPRYQRSKCAIMRDQNSIYILGGRITKGLIITRSCERLYPDQNDKFQNISSLNLRHNCPSGCILNGRVWVFSGMGIQFLEKNLWIQIEIPFGIKLNPFQFCTPINHYEILIMGGVDCNEQKSPNIQIFNTQKMFVDDFHSILPQGVCNQRVWSPSVAANKLALLCSVQAEVFPDVGCKKGTVQIIYLTSNGLHVHSIYEAKTRK